MTYGIKTYRELKKESSILHPASYIFYGHNYISNQIPYSPSSAINLAINKYISSPVSSSTEEMILSAEKNCGIIFPESYKTFLKEYGNGDFYLFGAEPLMGVGDKYSFGLLFYKRATISFCFVPQSIFTTVKTTCNFNVVGLINYNSKHIIFYGNGDFYLFGAEPLMGVGDKLVDSLTTTKNSLFLLCPAIHIYYC